MWADWLERAQEGIQADRFHLEGSHAHWARRCLGGLLDVRSYTHIGASETADNWRFAPLSGWLDGWLSIYPPIVPRFTYRTNESRTWTFWAKI